MLGPVAVEIRMRFGRKHAGHGHCGRGAAGRRVRVIDHIRHGSQTRGGGRRAGVQAPAGGTRGFPLHDHQHLLARARRRTGHTLRIQPDRLERAAGIVGVVAGLDAGIDQRHWQHLVLHILVVAEERGVVLVAHGGNAQYHQDRNQHAGDTPGSGAPLAGSRPDPDIFQVQPGRQHAGQQRPADEARIDPGTCLVGIGLQDVLDLVGVEIDVLRHHGPGGCCTEHQQQRHHDAVHAGPEQQLQNQVQHGCHQQRQGQPQVQLIAGMVLQGLLRHIAPETDVVDQQ